MFWGAIIFMIILNCEWEGRKKIFKCNIFRWYFCTYLCIAKIYRNYDETISTTSLLYVHVFQFEKFSSVYMCYIRETFYIIYIHIKDVQHIFRIKCIRNCSSLDRLQNNNGRRMRISISYIKKKSSQSFFLIRTKLQNFSFSLNQYHIRCEWEVNVRNRNFLYLHHRNINYCLFKRY